MRTIITCPGIGDFIWLAQKLVNSNECFKIVMSDNPPQRGHQVADILPSIVGAHEYRPNLKYSHISANNIQRFKRRWSVIQDPTFYLSANHHLEMGIRIEQFLPDLATSYILPYNTNPRDITDAQTLLPATSNYIGIYTSAYSNARNWNGWGVNEWFRLVKLLKRKNLTFVIIGADYDIGTSHDLMELMEGSKIKFVDTMGKPLSTVVEILKRLDYFIGFPSGLSILNETLGKNGTMFYSGPGFNSEGKPTPDHGKLMNSWADPARIKSGEYKGCLFCDPEVYFEWLKNDYQIFERL